VEPEEGTRPESGLQMSSRRVAVFIDYWWVYSSARQAFGGAQPPAWFGNVAPAALAHGLVKRPPSSVRRSERVRAGLHIFIRGYDPDVHRGQHERVERWLGEGATVDVGPVRTEGGGGFWQGSVSVALSCAVVEALTRGDCDTAVVFAGDAALLPLFNRMAGPQVPSARIELATWVARDGAVPTALASSVPGVWCHRLGESTFKQVSDDRRGARGRGAGAGRKGKADAQPTAMQAAFVAAGEPERSSAAAQLVHPDLLPETETPQRLGQRLFGQGA